MNEDILLQEAKDDRFFEFNDPTNDGNEEAVYQNDKDSPTVGEVYRRVLARFTCKEIRRALLKYRELMPKQSDWNRKLTQATLNPEIGFRYLYRCGQIDDNNHRTIQKMLRYVERQDIIPFFENIIYNHTLQNASLKDLSTVLNDSVDEYFKEEFVRLDDEASVHPEPEYTIYRCRNVKDHRVTRSKAAKRRHSDYEPNFHTFVKRTRRSNVSATPSELEAQSKSNSPSDSKHKKARNSDGVSQNSSTTGETIPTGPIASDLANYRMCEVRMQVRAEHGNYENLLRDRLASNRENVFDRQLDLFNQASTVLRLQDLGEISCDMRFADLLHLDCFWREFLNGGLSREIRAEFTRENNSSDDIDIRNVNFHVGLNYREYEKGRQILLANYKPRDPDRKMTMEDATAAFRIANDAATAAILANRIERQHQQHQQQQAAQQQQAQ